MRSQLWRIWPHCATLWSQGKPSLLNDQRHPLKAHQGNQHLQVPLQKNPLAAELLVLSPRSLKRILQKQTWLRTEGRIDKSVPHPPLPGSKQREAPPPLWVKTKHHRHRPLPRGMKRSKLFKASWTRQVLKEEGLGHQVPNRQPQKSLWRFRPRKRIFRLQNDGMLDLRVHHANPPLQRSRAWAKENFQYRQIILRGWRRRDCRLLRARDCLCPAISVVRRGQVLQGRLVRHVGSAQLDQYPWMWSHHQVN